MNTKQKDSESEILLFKKVSLIDKFNFYEYMSVMLESGV
jgi:hypothetical protein